MAIPVIFQSLFSYLAATSIRAFALSPKTVISKFAVLMTGHVFPLQFIMCRSSPIVDWTCFDYLMKFHAFVYSVEFMTFFGTRNCR